MAVRRTVPSLILLIVFSLVLRNCDAFYVNIEQSAPDHESVAPDSDLINKPATTSLPNLQLLLMQHSAAVLTARKLRSDQLKKAERLERIRQNSNRQKFGVADDSLVDEAANTIPDLSSIAFPFGKIFSAVPSLLARDIPAKDPRGAGLLRDLEFNINDGLRSIEESVLEFAPFPLNYVFHWWTAFRGFHIDSSRLPSWEQSVQNLKMLQLRGSTPTSDESTDWSAIKLLPFPLNYYSSWGKNRPKAELMMKYMFIDDYDDDHITVEEADHRVMSMIAPWLPWPWNKLSFSLLPFRAHEQERQANASMEGIHYSLTNDKRAIQEWKKIVEDCLEEEPSDRNGRGLLGLFGLSPLQFFPMLTPLNLLGKSFNSSGPRPFTLQIVLPSNKSMLFSNHEAPTNEVNITTSDGEVTVQSNPNYKLDLKYYYKVYPSPRPPTKFDPVAYNSFVNEQVDAALATFSASVESSTMSMDGSDGDGSSK